MGIRVKRYRRNANFGDASSPLKYYLRQQPGSYKVVTMEHIAKRLERSGAMSAQDITYAIKRFIIEMRDELVEGNRVKVGGLGTFHVTFETEGSVEEKDCTVAKIRRVRVRFFAGNTLNLVNDCTAETRGGKNNVQFYINSDGAAATNKAVNSEASAILF